MTFVDGLYSELLQRGIRYFLPDAEWETLEPNGSGEAKLTCERHADRSMTIGWLENRQRIKGREQPLTDAEMRMVQSIGRVLSARYEMLFNAPLAAQSYQLFAGLAEDRYVSAFLDAAPYRSAEALSSSRDRVSEAIGVLRISSSTTYENRRIETGVLLFGSQRDPCHAPPRLPEGALRYGHELTAIRSFHRLSDGLQTVALVDRDGLLVEIVDVAAWAQPYADFEVPVPTPARYLPHARATLCGGHVCLVLTPNGEIKIFAEGAEVFRFADGRWRLTDAAQRYLLWERSVGDRQLAEHLFRVALNLAEERRGALFVVLQDPASVEKLVAQGDLLNRLDGPNNREGKGQFHYLLRGARVLDVPSSVLETVARIDGAVVLDRESNILAFGAILQANAVPATAAEGGRTTAALVASHFGSVLKVSEDGQVAFYQAGHCAWEV